MNVDEELAAMKKRRSRAFDGSFRRTYADNDLPRAIEIAEQRGVEIERMKAGQPLLIGNPPHTCNHNTYWITNSGRCMACQLEESLAKAKALEAALAHGASEGKQ